MIRKGDTDIDEPHFAGFIEQERERLNRERDEIRNQQKELDKKLAALDREFAAVDAYEAAKTGKPIRATRQPSRRAASPGGGRRGSRREAVLQVIRENPGGIKRGEILERMGLKGDKPGEMSVSNSLTALIKSHQVDRREGRYVVSG